MSNTQNTFSTEASAIRHTVVNYISTAGNGLNITKAMSSQRLVTACYREDKKTGTNRTNRACSIPLITMEEITSKLDVLKPLLLSYLESTQDKIFRTLLDANGVNGTVTDIADLDINLDAVIAALQDSDSSGNRLTKESIGHWFSENLEAQLSLVLADKLGIGEIPTDAESKKVEFICAEYKAKFAAMAGGKTSYNEKLAISLKKALELAEPEDKLAASFGVKLDKMIAAAQVKADMFDLL